MDKQSKTVGQFSLSWLFTEVTLIAVSLSCLVGVDWHRNGVAADGIFLPCGFALSAGAAIGGLFGQHVAGLLFGSVFAAMWLLLLWFAVTGGAFE